MKQVNKKKAVSPYDRFAAMSDVEKENVYRELDDPSVARRAKPMSPAMKKLWTKAKGKGGRPRVGRGATRVLISVERGLLEDADAYARRAKMSRSELFSRGIRAMIRKAG
jgi:hypothetical protein